MTPRARGHIATKVLFAVALVATLIVGYRVAARDEVFPRNFGVVEPGVLYRAARLTPAATRQVVERYAIKTIVDLGAYDKSPADEEIARRTALALGVKRYVMRLNGDGTGNPDYYVQALKVLLDPANQPALVHCAAGTQRTGACVMMYRHMTQGTPYEAGLEEAKTYGHDPQDNPKLWPYVQKNAAEIERRVREAEAPR